MVQANVAELMGGSRVLGEVVHNPLDLAALIEAGLPREAAEQVREHWHLTEQEMAECVGMSTKTLQRLAKQPKGLLSQVQPDALPANWRDENVPLETHSVGADWTAKQPSILLRVPSVVIPNEHNYLANPHHPDFSRLIIQPPQPFSFDPRLTR